MSDVDQRMLKPCPFCGSPAELKMIGNDWILANKKLTARSKLRCGCEISCSGRCGCKHTTLVLRYSLEWAREQCIASWNTRHGEGVKIASDYDALAARLEAAVEVLEKVVARGCRCYSSHHDDWHSKECPMPQARAVLASATLQEPKP
jgi:hypothetical protein